MDRCALFVDAGYLLADGAMAVHGTRNRDSVSWDYAGLVQLLNEVARDRTQLPLLRCYWYEATSDGRRTQEQDGIADIPGIKFRAARIRPGRREGVESYVQRDLTTLARTGVLCEAVLVSGDEDMAQVVSDVQDLGVRVTAVHISVEGNWTISRSLRRECDDLIEIGAGHLRPHVTLLAGAGEDEATETTAPLSNGRSHSPPEMPRRPVAAKPQPGRVEPAAAQSGGYEPAFAGTGGQPAMTGSAMDQLRAMQQSIAQQRGGDHLAPQGAGGVDPQRSPSGPIDANGFPSGGQTPPHMGGGGTHTGMAPGQQPGGDPGYGMPSNTGPHPGMRGAQNPYGPPQTHQAPPQHQPGPPTGGHPPQQPHPTGGHPVPGHPTGGHPSMGGHGYDRENPPARNTPPPAPDPRYGPNTGENPGFGGNTGPNPTFGASTEVDSQFGSTGGTRSGSAAGTGPQPDHRLQHGPYTDPTPTVGPPPPGRASHSMDDAVNVAHREGHDFAESIARDAPALWMEAVLVRRPRMPSDLEARLLQGSALPIDFLLRDEVREALRQGFWGALERAARG
ncbi:NYN domain-containing protein [Streptomonospora wellingtoniae]|uniref:NYN domain-containing protein n=1 Tax=Streptomonospora wellingtoniae TaxID=3075544 RepID=A0ABU2KRE5_9ACTN|nr:NYN domain-containing protein [Streptomonospora sp. DSM 45055]MDT0301818.1 NYN domain-containing protein [Streptomonospora sp. DSM 45055]